MARDVIIHAAGESPSWPTPGGGAVAHGRELDAANTGPEAAGYTPTAYGGSYTVSTNGAVLEGYRFGVGQTLTITGNNVTIRGCEFRTTDPNFFVVRVDGTNTTFEDCRWRPHTTDAGPVSMAQSYQQGIKMFNGVGLTVRRCEFWGFGNAIEFEPSSATGANPIVVEECWMHDAADQAGDTYHHDGILSSYAAGNVTVRRCKINSGGNTNAIAFQSTGTAWPGPVVIEDSQFGGFGYTVNIGDSAGASNVTFTGNEFDRSIVDPVWGPFKNSWGGFGGTNVWSGNTRSDDGSYWWPSDGTTSSNHATDYSG